MSEASFTDNSGFHWQISNKFLIVRNICSARNSGPKFIRNKSEDSIALRVGDYETREDDKTIDKIEFQCLYFTRHKFENMDEKSKKASDHKRSHSCDDGLRKRFVKSKSSSSLMIKASSCSIETDNVGTNTDNKSQIKDSKENKKTSVILSNPDIKIGDIKTKSSSKSKKCENESNDIVNERIKSNEKKLHDHQKQHEKSNIEELAKRSKSRNKGDSSQLLGTYTLLKPVHENVVTLTAANIAYTDPNPPMYYKKPTKKLTLDSKKDHHHHHHHHSRPSPPYQKQKNVSDSDSVYQLLSNWNIKELKTSFSNLVDSKRHSKATKKQTKKIIKAICTYLGDNKKNSAYDSHTRKSLEKKLAKLTHTLQEHCVNQEKLSLDILSIFLDV